MPGDVAASPRRHPDPELPAAPQQRPFTPKPALNAATHAHPLSQNFGLLITEIAARLEPLPDILRRHGISKSQFRALRAHPSFEKTLEEQVKAFASLANLPARIKMKSQLLVEMLLDQMYDIAYQPLNPASARVSAFSMITRLTGLERPEDASPPRKVSLTINLGDGRQKSAETVTIEAIRDRDTVAGTTEFSFAGEDGGNNGEPVQQLGYMDASDVGYELDDRVGVDTPSDDPATVAAPTLGWYDFKAQSGPQPSNHPGPDQTFEKRPLRRRAAEGTAAESGGDPAPEPTAPAPTLRKRISALRMAQNNE